MTSRRHADDLEQGHHPHYLKLPALIGRPREMRSFNATITSQRQVTIPAEVRRRLGLKKHGKVTFVIEGDGVRLVPTRHTFESAHGAVPAIPGTSLDFDREIEEAMCDEANRRLVRLP
jgi:AbrB family looped-hinge helix DNA binding protein